MYLAKNPFFKSWTYGSFLCKSLVFHDPVRTEEQGRNLLGRLYHRENGFGTRITTTEEQLQGSDTLPLLPCALCSVFTGTEAQRKEQRCRNKKGNLPFLPSLLRFRPASARVDPF